MARQDIQWWSQFIRIFNGKSAISNEWYSLSVYTDASLLGFAACMGQDWVAGVWKPDEKFYMLTDCSHVVSGPSSDRCDLSNINELELWAVLVGVQRWFPLFRNKAVLLFVDNTQVVYMLRNGTSVNKTCMNWLREIFWMAVIYNIQLHPTYIASEDNVVADVLSRIPYGNVSVEVCKDLCCSDELDVLFHRYKTSVTAAKSLD